jgi:hypothetical protein
MKNWKRTLACAAAILVVITALTVFSGCIDKPEELQDKVNIYVYEEAGQEGDPQEKIREFYDMVEEQSGPPEIVPVAQYAVELDPDTGDIITIYDPDGNPVDRETALSMQDDIVRDDAGNIITDAALLDLHIDPIGKNKYQILNLRQKMEDPDGGIWRIKGFPEHDSFDKKLVDNIMKVGDHKDEITGGFVLGNDGNIYGVIIADEDVFDMYGGDFRTKAGGENLSDTISKEECIDLGGGLYAYLYNLSETPKGGASVHSPQPYCEEIATVADRENNGKFAQFGFRKESS